MNFRRAFSICFTLAILFLTAVLYNNCGKGKKLGTSATTSNEKSNSTLEGFSRFVYPIVREHCSSCHALAVKPNFAHADVVIAHDQLMTNEKVNLVTPSASRLYKRLINDLHNCWSDCNANADEMLSAIQKWQDTIDLTSLGQNIGKIKLTSTATIREELDINQLIRSKVFYLNV